MRNTASPIPTEELKKYTNVKELVIEGNGVNDFSWIVKLSSLESLALINTVISNGDILTKIHSLKKFFLSRNRSLENYDFLINMKIDTLFIGKNGKADISSLYALKNVITLVVKENLLHDIDFERFSSMLKYDEEIQDVRRVQRWIEEPLIFKWPKNYPINYFLLSKTKKEQLI